MTGEMPSFYMNGHLHEIDGWEYLDDEASEADRQEYEEFYNDANSRVEYMSMYPNMKHPYRMWNGKIVDRESD